MKSEPSIKTGTIILLTGIIIIIAGIVLEWIQQYLIEFRLHFLALSTTFYSDIGLGIAVAGIGWIISSINPLRKFYLIPISIGAILPALTLTLGQLILDIGYPGAITWYIMIFTVPPAFIVSGVVAGLVVEKHRRKDKLPEFNVALEKYLLISVSIALFLIFLREPLALLRVMFLALVTWILWHFASPRLAFYLLTRKIRKDTKRYELILHHRVEEELTFSNAFSKSYYPLAFGIGFSLTLFNIIELFPFIGGLLPSEPMEKVVQLAMISILAIVVGSTYVGPVVWLYRNSGIRIKDNSMMIVEEPKIHSFANNLVEVYGFIQAPIGFTIAAAGGDYLYAVTLLALLIVTILTVSLSATVLYVRFSSKHNLRSFATRLLMEGYMKPPAET